MIYIHACVKYSNFSDALYCSRFKCCKTEFNFREICDNNDIIAAVLY